jgi:hypothetical protein
VASFSAASSSSLAHQHCRAVQLVIFVLPTYFMVALERTAEKFFLFLFGATLAVWCTCYLGACPVLQHRLNALGAGSDGTSPCEV